MNLRIVNLSGITTICDVGKITDYKKWRYNPSFYMLSLWRTDGLTEKTEKSSSKIRSTSSRSVCSAKCPPYTQLSTVSYIRVATACPWDFMTSWVVVITYHGNGHLLIGWFLCSCAADRKISVVLQCMLGLSGWLTTLFWCIDTVGWVTRPVEISSPKYTVSNGALNLTHAVLAEQTPKKCSPCFDMSRWLKN